MSKTGSLDSFRLIAAFLVIANHTSPLLSYGENGDFILTRIIARVAVPFFLMVSGYFLYKYIENGDKAYILSFCKKIAILYALSIFLYLPLNLYAGHYEAANWGQELIKDIIFDGTFYHLWYFPGLILGVMIVAFLVRKIGLKFTFFISLILYIIGLFGDSYYGVTETLSSLETFYDVVFTLSDYTRNGVFMVPIFLMLGMLIYKGNHVIPLQRNLLFFIISFSLLILEGLLLHAFELQRHDSMYIMLVPAMYFLFRSLLQIRGKSSKGLRTISTIMYIIHPWIIVLVRSAAEIFKLENWFVDNSLLHFAAVSFFTFAAARLATIVWKREKNANPPPTGRAWVEIDLQALRENARQLIRILPEKTKLMAVVKANAYGHGSVKIAKELSQTGINSFAVATLAEAIELRSNGIKGDILILGYTPAQSIRIIKKYNFTQTVIGLEHAKELNRQAVPINIQIKIDTGMHRLGTDASGLADLKEIYQCKHLTITGVFSHLAVSDSLDPDDIAFTNRQIDRYNQTIQWLESQHLPVGHQHIQASYGILNYPHLQYDYARAGITLYGVLSQNDRVNTNVELKPVLSIKARVAMVKSLHTGEELGYGRSFTAASTMKTAVITIGYADGIPRNMANGHVLIRSQKAPIIGRICMDQLLVDVSGIEGVQADDIATLIGKDGSQQITAEDVSESCGTITNELLSRLGERLGYVYKI
ncbi:serine racemase VanT catalytic subunit [Cytobacillus gottheilii]|uniref:serine racemase VanT catalytic subunit n=1 Tax=Cytobacillus gottheilii TaxID=859144 RepID=UPI0009BB9C1E|nr:serine racemase VanT catalytic subunit [Cytobacillus gottheilii]